MNDEYVNHEPDAAPPEAAAVPTTQAPTPQEGSPAPQEAEARPGRWHVFWREWVRPLMIIAAVMFSFRSAVADWNDVPTGSMKPTILEGDRIFINKVAYDLKFPFTRWRLAEWGSPNWGDIVVLRSPEDGKRLVKRVVGLPGDLLEVRHGRLYLNGQPASYLALDEKVVREIDMDMRSVVFSSEKVANKQHAVMFVPGAPSNFGPLRVPEDHFFVMGDNRTNSRDSRWFGPVHRSAILGRATAVALSLDFEHPYFRVLPRPRFGRFFSELQ